MHFPFCTGKRWGKGRREAKATSKSPISWTPSSHGQLESERLIAGDVTASSDLSTLITRAGVTSARVPHLNSNGVVATSELLQGHTEEGISHLAEDQAAAQRRSQATSRPWTFGSLFFSNASLIGEDFQQSLMGLCGQDSRESVHIENKAPRSTACPGHWQLVFCPNQDCSAQHPHREAPQSRPLTAEDVDRLSDRPVPVPFQPGPRVSLTSSLEEELDAKEAEEEGEEFPFDAHLKDESEYEQALCEITAIAARAGSPKLISLSRKHEVGNTSTESAAMELKGQPTDEQRWSTQAQTGCPQACTAVSKKQGSLQISRLSLTGPPSGPPSIALPPTPPSSLASLPLRSSE